MACQCDVLQVTRSGFYAWKKRPASEHEARRDALASEIRSINSEQYLDVYGSPRMHQKLLKRGFEVCENTVAAVMKQEGITASTEKKFRVQKNAKIANNLQCIQLITCLKQNLVIL